MPEINIRSSRHEVEMPWNPDREGPRSWGTEGCV